MKDKDIKDNYMKDNDMRDNDICDDGNISKIKKFDKKINQSN